MSIPVWFLDIDGVTAPLADPTHDPDGTPIRWETFRDGTGYRRDITDRIARLHQSGRVHVVWCSTWGGEANWSGGWPSIGLGPFEVCERGSEAPGGWWKADVVRAFLDADPNHAAIWTDDALVERHDDPESGHETGWDLDDYTDRLLPICPDGSRGLTPSDLDHIEAWLGAREQGKVPPVSVSVA